MKIFTFRCSGKPDLFAVSLNPVGDNLPANICSGTWHRQNDTEVEPGDPVVGFVSRDLFRDLERQGYHLASGVRSFTVSRQVEMQIEVGEALSSANARTRFFTTDTDA